MFGMWGVGFMLSITWSDRAENAVQTKVHLSEDSESGISV